MPNYLVLDRSTMGGGACAAYRYVNATPSQIGNTFGVRLSAANGSGNQMRNSIIQFQGNLYAVAQDGVYKKDDPTTMTGGWTQDLAFTTPGNNNSHSGLYVTEIQGIAIMFCIWPQTTNQWRWAKFDGTSWTQASAAQAVIYSGQTVDEILFQGSLYRWNTGHQSMVFDPGTESFSALSNPLTGNSSENYALGIFQNRLFTLGPRGTTPRVWLAEQISGGWFLFDEIVMNPGGFNDQGKWALFSDGTYLYGIFSTVNADSDRGWHCMRWDGNFNRTDISAEVLPNMFLSTNNGGPGSNPISGRFIPVIDLNSSPGTPTWYLYYSTAGTFGIQWTMYQWNYDPLNPTSNQLITSLESGGNVGHDMPTGYPNHGERIWTASEQDVKIVSRTTIAGAERIGITAYGGGTNLKARMYYSVGGSPQLIEATLSGPAEPVTSGVTFSPSSNIIEGIDADGTTVYTFTWEAALDGINVGDRVIRVIELFS